MKKKIIYALSIVMSVVLLAAGYFAVKDGYDFDGGMHADYVRAKIIRIIGENVENQYGTSTVTTVTFEAEIKSGDRKGDTVNATQTIDSSSITNTFKVSEGDTVILAKTALGSDESWSFAEYVRSDAIIILGVLFCLILVVFGRMKGLKTLFTLTLTVLSVFFILVPAILGERNIYFWTIVVCLYITAMTLITVNGISYMSLIAGIGCMGGVLIAAAITLVVDQFIRLTGFTDECTIYIYAMSSGRIDLKALVFAGILIGAIGAVMDVAVNISASVHEVASKIARPTFKELFKSGITISRDILGTMSNTLILAYIGSALCSVILIIYNNSFSMLNMFNRENLIVELLKILVGSFGILSALPLTSAVAAFFYTKFEKFNAAREESSDDEYSEMLDNFNRDN